MTAIQFSNSWVKNTCAQRETLASAGFAMKGSNFAGLHVEGATAVISSMQGRSNTASTTKSPTICERG
jgi:hypothetical protein